ncbi:MAG: RNA 2',3'-cyclic phosphodiesterase [Ignavibacteriae bacterium]|nr:RNA 2',3'-cyclic phosphodiesterase [Ignavibacteriota bacterium]
MRTFISLNLSEETKREFARVQDEVKDSLDSRAVDSIKWEGKDKFHQTLFFLGDTAENMLVGISRDLEKIKPEISFEKISFTANEITAFPNLRYPRVLVIGLENPDGNAFILYDKICEKLSGYGYAPDKKFHPHITLGRVRRERKVNLVSLKEKIKFRIEFSVNEFFLMESRLDSSGSVYREIKKFPLF